MVPRPAPTRRARLARFRYFGTLGACLAVTAPLEAFYGPRVWRRPLRLARVLAAPVALFSAWDVVAIRRGHWTFDRSSTSGWTLPGRLPVEEVAFFVTVPVCAILSYEAVRRSRGR
jgi:lycopene cyclase domain-containing protein